MKKKILYENFHKTTHSQKKIITENNFTYRIILKIINTYIKKSKTILDIGCGAGTLCLYYANRGKNMLGIDVSKKAIMSAQESAKFLRLNNISFKMMEFPKKFPKGTFDFIIFTEVIEHLENDELALKRLFSLLKTNGIAVISTPSKNAPLHKLGYTKSFDKKVGHLRRYSMEELINKCEKCGFKIIGTKKTEGIIRNFLFLNPIAGKFVRFIKFFLSDWITYIDNMSLKLFGESNIFVIIQKTERIRS